MPSQTDRLGNIAYFGRATFGNFVDWLVTICLGVILVVITISLGGVRPGTHLWVLPLFMMLLGLHGFWLMVNDEAPKRISHVPLFFAPFLLWMLVNVMWISPAAWRGWPTVIYTFEAFIFLWVLINNVTTRAHLWLLIIFAFIPAANGIFNAFFQFFQDPTLIANALVADRIVLSPVFLGQATGIFADPNSLAILLLSLLPAVIMVAAVPRLPIILRFLAGYTAVMFVVGLVLTQLFWAIFVCLAVFIVVPWFCFNRLSRRLLFTGICGFGLIATMALLVIYQPRFTSRFEELMRFDGQEGSCLRIWNETVRLVLDKPLLGHGVGTFEMAFEQSPRTMMAEVPLTPGSDFLLILSECGLLGAVLLIVPGCVVLFCAWRQWQAEPVRIKLRESKKIAMSFQRFFISIGLLGAFAIAACLMVGSIISIPALILYVAFFLAILVKSSFSRRIRVPSGGMVPFGYFVLAVSLGTVFQTRGGQILEAYGCELNARERLEQIVEGRIHVTGDGLLLDQVIADFEDATSLAATNADAWIGLSAARCQLFYRRPAEYELLGRQATLSAQRAVELCDTYWLAWGQLGVSQALAGDTAGAEQSLAKALELAPRSSNAHFFWAAFLGNDPARHDEAIATVRRSLEINPKNSAAKRLEQKLLIP